jgi:hypothetical protein
MQVESLNDLHGAMVYLIFRNNTLHVIEEYWISPLHGDHDWSKFSQTHVIPIGTESVEIGVRLWGHLGQPGSTI